MKVYFKTDMRPTDAPALLTASADELRVLLLVLSSEAGESTSSLAARLSLSEGDVRDALAFWRGAGLVTDVRKPEGTADACEAEKKKAQGVSRPVESADRLSPYSPKEAATLIEKDALAPFIEVCQETYGKVLGPADIEKILGLYDQLQLSPEYVCMLIAHCNEYGRKPMRYIEKLAFSLYDEGIVTVEALSCYIEKTRRLYSREGKLRRLFGIGERALTKREKECFLRWCEEYGYDDAVIGLAYDITVGATGKAAVGYADKLLSKWHASGCRSVGAVEELIERERAARKTAAPTKKKPSGEGSTLSSLDVDDMFDRALARSYGGTKKP